VAARALGLEPTDVTVQMGDSNLPPLMIAGGSNNAASAAHAVAKACEEIRQKIAAAAVNTGDGIFHGADPASLRLENGRLVSADNKSESFDHALSRIGHRLEVYAENIPPGVPRAPSQT
jgi:xanthine dehydrogenase YagR molybdenum-binding subunit